MSLIEAGYFMDLSEQVSVHPVKNNCRSPSAALSVWRPAQMLPDCRCVIRIRFDFLFLFCLLGLFFSVCSEGDSGFCFTKIRFLQNSSTDFNASSELLDFRTFLGTFWWLINMQSRASQRLRFERNITPLRSTSHSVARVI